MKGAHGEEADFKGVDHGVYNALSAKNLSFNLLVEHDTFRTTYSKLNVHGSWIRASFHTIRTVTGRILQIFFHAKDPHKAIITEGCTAPYCRDASSRSYRYVLSEGAAPFKADNIKVELRRKKLEVTTGQWHTESESTVGAPHHGKLRMNIEVKPTYAVRYDIVAPHGLLGQARYPVAPAQCVSPPLFRHSGSLTIVLHDCARAADVRQGPF